MWEMVKIETIAATWHLLVSFFGFKATFGSHKNWNKTICMIINLNLLITAKILYIFRTDIAEVMRSHPKYTAHTQILTRWTSED